MPFLGKDPTGPGYNWVKTGNGWKVITDVREQVNRQIKKFARDRIPVYSKFERRGSHPGEGPSGSNSNPASYNKYDKTEDGNNYIFLPSSWRSSRQSGAFLTAGDILDRFDLCSAVRDHQRFSYVCKVLEIICDKHFSTLGGSSIKNLFSVLEEVVEIVKETQRHIRRIIKLLEMITNRMSLNSTRITGSRIMYNCRLHLLNLWLNQLQDIHLYEREEDGLMKLLDLPLECLEYIFRCFTDPRDILHLCQTCHKLHSIGSDPILWEELFLYHFTEGHLSAVPYTDGYPDWKGGFRNLKKANYLRDDHYPVMMELCCHCSCIYWQGGNHPCSNHTLKEKETREEQRTKEITTLPLDPMDFMKVTVLI